jgi:dienelactone hydrolase
MRRTILLLLATSLLAAMPARADSGPARLDAAVRSILAEPYQPGYIPTGSDTAFPDSAVANTAPAQDYTTGSIPGSPDAPAWPAAFQPVLFSSADGAPLLGQLGLHPGKRPGVVVVHGFNTHGYASVVRWAATLYAAGYNVLAADQRDFSFAYSAGLGYPTWQQTFGWKESEDVQAAGRYLAAQAGVGSVGLVGFSEGGQNTVLALALDAAARHRVFAAGLQFSGPADQSTQIYSTAVPPGCETPLCTYPATEALALLVVPPYSTGNPCTILDRAAVLYGTDSFSILAHETAVHAQAQVRVPLLSIYAADDSLVPAFQAQMMAGYAAGNPLLRVLEVQRGEHAYFFDRWWQQRAMLRYFKTTLADAASNPAIGVAPTVDQTPGGAPFGSQLVPLAATRASADAMLAPFPCDTSRGAPGAG